MRLFKSKSQPQKGTENSDTDSYGRYPRYTILIAAWTLTVALYVYVLEKAVHDHEYLGTRGSAARSRNFDVLSFFRTGLATIHVPVLVTVLASTIPYWNMVPSDRENCNLLLEPHDENDYELDTSTSVTQLFYLADRTWSGLIGWVTTIHNGFKVRCPSAYWIHLALVAALSYIGFPLLSVAYVIQSTQYWDSSQIPVSTSIGNLNSSYEDAIKAMHQTELWINGGPFVAPPNIHNLSIFNSSQEGAAPYLGLSKDVSWAHGSTIVTLPLFASGNAQVSTVALQVSASCSEANYNETIFFPELSQDPEFELDFNFEEIDPDENSGLPYKLSCKQNCSSNLDVANPSCFINSSFLTMWPSDSRQPDFQYSTGEFADAVFPKFTGQTLSCITIRNSSYSLAESTASIQLAVQGPRAWTSVRSCNLSVTYARPTVNTLIGEFMQATMTESSSSSLLQIRDLTPDRLLGLSIASPLYLFHNGPPPARPGAEPATDGFNWISWLSEYGAGDIPAAAFKPGASLANLNPFEVLTWDGAIFVLQNPLRPIGWVIVDNPDITVGRFNESVFLKPLASIISRPGFFGNGTAAGVVFKTEIELTHGKFPSVLAIIILMLPIFWTLGCSHLATRRKRWTSTLDAFAMFKLGGDWRDNLQELRLAGLSRSKDALASIPRLVYIDADRGVAKLAPRRKRIQVQKKMNNHEKRPETSEPEASKHGSVSGVVKVENDNKQQHQSPVTKRSSTQRRDSRKSEV